MKDAVASMRILVILDTVSLARAKMKSNHALVEAMDQLIKHKLLSFTKLGKNSYSNITPSDGATRNT